MPDPVVSSADSELRAHVERALSAHFELDCEIGRGGMGIVYRARDRRLKRICAIKLLPPELTFRSEIKTRFLREAETAAQLSHPNIVPIYTVDETEGLVYFVMAYVNGDNLAKRLHDRGVMAVDQTRRILIDVADALAYAHERGVVHRDIKPDNILLDAESGRPMVTDFGIARAISGGGDSRLTATGMAIGTPAYMSPEQAAGDREIDGRSDLYSLGIVAYQMLVGEPPFVASSTPAMLVKHISERPMPVQQRRSEVPDDLARAVMILLEKDPTNRFPSASALVAALESGVVPTMAESGRMPTGRPDAGSGAASSAPQYEPGRGSGYNAALPVAAAERLPVADAPTAEDRRRWEADGVVKFRKKLAPYLFVNSVIVIASIVGGSDFFGVTVIWSIYMAFKYAKLWADGYDWRDVFRQPRERELIDVCEDTIEWTRSLFDRKKRQELREHRRVEQIARRTSDYALGDGSAGAAGMRFPSAGAVDGAGPYAARIRQARTDRDEIVRIIDSMPPGERSRVPDVARSAGALHDRIQSLAISLSDLDRNASPGGKEAIETEVSRLEGAANPLDRVASEERVRRLAYLKRQRRVVADLAQRRDAVATKLETCADALRNMKIDILRLRAGAQTHQHITSLAVDALHLADSVDSALYVADELGRAGAARSSARTSARSV